MFFVAFGSIAVLAAAGVFIGRNIGHHYGINNCHRWGQTTDRQVKFVDYSWWSWGCLTPSAQNPHQWIPIGQVVQVNK